MIKKLRLPGKWLAGEISVMQRKFTSLLIGCLTALLVSCGGGGGGTLAEGGIGGTGVSYGKAASLGSVTVNSTKFEFDNNTVFIIDGNSSSSQDDLKVGFVLRVEGDFDTSIASRVEYEETVRGPVENGSVTITNPDNSAATMTVLGQAVRTNSLTVFDNLVLDPLNPSALDGQVVDISGLREADGTIVASYIEAKTLSVNEYRVTGVVDSVAGSNFTIADLTVDGRGLPSLPSINDLVRVKGESTDFNTTTTRLLASSVDPGIAPSPNSGDNMEIEGFITDFNSQSDFKVNGVSVDATGASVSGTGVLGNDLRVEVEGIVDDNSFLQSDKVEIKPSNDISIEATVTGFTAEPNTFTVLDGLVQVRVTESTQMEDKAGANPVQLFGFNNLQIGDFVEVRGFLEGDTVVATKLERDELEPDFRLQAPATNIDPINGSLELIGISINTDLDTEYEDVNDTPFSSPEQENFFDALAVLPGGLVKAKWKEFTSTSIPVDELSLELEDD